MREFAEFVLKPDSPILFDMIGQHVIDLGYYEAVYIEEERKNDHFYSRDGRKQRLKNLLIEWGDDISLIFSDFMLSTCIIVLILEKQCIAIEPSDHIMHPRLEIHPNLTFEKAKSIFPDYTFYLYSVTQDPEMSNQMVREMIGKKILAIDLIQLEKRDVYTDIENAFCILKLYLDDGIEKLIGYGYEPGEPQRIRIKNANELDSFVVKKIYPIRKDGYRID